MRYESYLILHITYFLSSYHMMILRLKIQKKYFSVENLYTEVFRLANCYRNIFTKHSILNHFDFLIQNDILVKNCVGGNNTFYSVSHSQLLSDMIDASLPFLGRSHVFKNNIVRSLYFRPIMRSPSRRSPIMRSPIIRSHKIMGNAQYHHISP